MTQNFTVLLSWFLQSAPDVPCDLLISPERNARADVACERVGRHGEARPAIGGNLRG